MTETATPTAEPVATNPPDVLVPLPNVAKTPATPPAAAETPKEAPAEDAATEDKPEKPKKPASERISELYAKTKDAERRAQAAESEAYRLREQLRAPSKAAADDFSAQDTERVMRAVKSERFEQTVQEMDSAKQAARAAQADMFHAKVDAARERMPDLDAALGTFLKMPLSDAACQIIAESDKAAELAYYLSKNPVQAERLNTLPPHLQGAELARMEARVSSAAKKTSTAPPPVPTIGGTNSPAGRKDPSEMSMEEYADFYKGRSAKR